MEGWIKLHRQIINNAFYFSEKFTKGQAWVDLLLLATHKKNYVNIRGVMVKLTAGELCYSQETLAGRWKWNVKTVKKFLNLLEEEEMIELKTSNVTTVIRIINWNKYQNGINGNQKGLENDTISKEYQENLVKNGEQMEEQSNEQNEDEMSVQNMSNTETNNNVKNVNNEKNGNNGNKFPADYDDDGSNVIREAKSKNTHPADYLLIKIFGKDAEEFDRKQIKVYADNFGWDNVSYAFFTTKKSIGKFSYRYIETVLQNNGNWTSIRKKEYSNNYINPETREVSA